MGSELEQAVVLVLTTAEHPLRASEIVDRLAAVGSRTDRTSVNQLLYGALASYVTQDGASAWSLRIQSGDTPRVAPQASRSAAPRAQGSPSGSTRDAPRCPVHHIPMRRRLAQRGKRAGKSFWGCPEYPACKETINVDDGDADAPAARQAADRGAPASSPVPGNRPAEDTRLRVPVRWFDATLRRDGWACRYATAGGSLRALPESLAASRPLATCWVARPETPPVEPSAAREAFVASIQKFLQRGATPPLHPDAERRLLERAGLGAAIAPSPRGDVAPRLGRRVPAAPTTLRDLWRVEEFEPEPGLHLDSDDEHEFFEGWIASNLPAEVARSVIPQAPLDSLARAERDNRADGLRRVDFLVRDREERYLAVEIDGRQHDSSQEVDAARDAVLADLGIETIRISTEQLRAHTGPGLAAVLERCRRFDGEAASTPTREETLLAQGPSLVHRAVLALVEALSVGLLEGDEWSVAIDEPLGVVHELIPPYLDVLAAYDVLWAAGVMPDTLTLHDIEGGAVAYERQGARYVVDETKAPTPAQCVILLQPELGPADALGIPDGLPIVVVRSADLPVRVKDRFNETPARAQLAEVPEAGVEALQVLLRAVFAKEGFRDGQVDALIEVLHGRSCAVLLPTGGGKSLIYQLAGLVLPGRTLIVDPIVSLMEDQVRGLRAQGFDRVAAISSSSVQEGGREHLLQTVASGDAYYVFIAPERLQQRGFREALQQLAQTTAINLAVVDEAHCVSEWGHAFRTAYLNLGRILKTYCASRPDDAGPPVLALTGTASRAVLRDVLLELEIERDSDRALVRPRSFDRNELRYDIVRTRPGVDVATLKGAIETLPRRFTMPESDFFEPRDDKTMSGIIFVPHTNGPYGVTKVAEGIREAAGAEVTVYSGGAPKGWDERRWDRVKRENAESFKRNRAPLMVSTKAFGMGIDKPNVRYVVHYGIPGSIEAYYQEVGRGGRDGDRAECVLVAVEFDERRARRLLDDHADLEAIRAEVDAVKWRDSDDVTRQLFFHLKSFTGHDDELGVVREVLEELSERLGEAGTIEIPMDAGKDRPRERALHRLVLLGVVDDYLVNWGGKKYEVVITHASSGSVLESLVAYVRRSQPGRAETIAASLDGVTSLPLAEAVVACARSLIDFVYDTVERSRRRSLREMWLAAREGAGDPNGEFRQRILDYLTQGDIAPALERLLDEREVDLVAWRELLDTIERPDAAELRGNTGRLLASYPDHPGLLLARGVSEVLVSGGEIAEFASSIEAAAHAAPRYAISTDALTELAQWLFQMLRERDVAGGITAAYGALSGAGVPGLRGLIEDGDYQREPGLSVAVLRDGLVGAVAGLDAISEALGALADHDDPKVMT